MRELTNRERELLAGEILEKQDKCRSENVRRVLCALAYALNGEDSAALVNLDDQMYREEKSARGA